MWIFLTDSFLSIVDKGDASGETLLVRARKKGDIEKVFPDAEVQAGMGTDYQYRARVDRSAVADKVAACIRGIQYANFKSAVSEQTRHDAYVNVWGAMYAFQTSEMRE